LVAGDWVSGCGLSLEVAGTGVDGGSEVAAGSKTFTTEDTGVTEELHPLRSVFSRLISATLYFCNPPNAAPGKVFAELFTKGFAIGKRRWKKYSKIFADFLEFFSLSISGCTKFCHPPVNELHLIENKAVKIAYF
jgi:hypothetical protein